MQVDRKAYLCRHLPWQHGRGGPSSWGLRRRSKGLGGAGINTKPTWLPPAEENQSRASRTRCGGRDRVLGHGLRACCDPEGVRHVGYRYHFNVVVNWYRKLARTATNTVADGGRKSLSDVVGEGLRRRLASGCEAGSGAAGGIRA